MEPDKDFEEIFKTYTWDATYPTSSVAATKEKTVADFTTRELLNECYRRRAIERFSLQFEIDRFTTKDGVIDHIVKFKEAELMEFVHRSKFTKDKALYQASTLDSKSGKQEVVLQVYVCAHPSRLKDASDRS